MGFSWSFGLTNSVQPNSLAVKHKSKKKMHAKFNIEWIKNQPGLTLWVHMTGLIQLIQNELYEYDGKKTVTQLHKMVYQYYDKSDF